jgi:type IV secretory pathway VirB2 component (pilin)
VCGERANETNEHCVVGIPSQIAIATIGPLRNIHHMAQSFDPGAPSGNSLLAATQWVEGVLLGGFGTTVAVIAVASVGMVMLNGQASPRRALQVVLGAFILFGAPLIAHGLAGLVRSGSGGPNATGYRMQVQVPPSPSMPPSFDPYAGAAVPGPHK